MDENVKKLLENNKSTKVIDAGNTELRPGWDWSGADLAGWQLSKVKLSEPANPANLEKANLENAKLLNVDLRNANLSKANLNHADLKSSILVRANLEGVNAKSANFQKTYLREASLKGARLQHSDFRKANLCEADLQHTKMRYANLRFARLENANFQGANLRHTNFELAYVKNSNFTKADLKDASMDKAYLRGCNFDKAYMKQINLKRTILGGACFRNANLTNATLKYAEFDNKSDIYNINLFQSKLDYSTLKNCRKNLDRVVIQERQGKVSEAKDVYLNLKNYFRNEGLYDISGEYYYREKLMERKLLYKSRNIIDKILWLKSLLYSAVCGYGEKPYRVITSSMIIILIFGFIYMFFSGLESSTTYELKWYDNFYFSVVTFTTLGFGDIHPSDNVAVKICAMIESFTGAFMIALFVLTFGRRMLR